MRHWRWIALSAFVAAVTGTVVTAGAEEIVLGGQCDRTGPTKNVGVQMYPGIFDYLKLVNKKGGLHGHTLATSKWKMPTKWTVVSKPTSG